MQFRSLKQFSSFPSRFHSQSGGRTSDKSENIHVSRYHTQWTKRIQKASNKQVAIGTIKVKTYDGGHVFRMVLSGGLLGVSRKQRWKEKRNMYVESKFPGGINVATPRTTL